MSPWTTAVLALLACAAAMVLVRLWIGPSMLDRAIALDTLLVIVASGVGTLAAERRTGYFLSVLLVVAFLGFTGSVSIARFISVQDRQRPPADPHGETRGKTHGEMRGHAHGKAQEGPRGRPPGPPGKEQR